MQLQAIQQVTFGEFCSIVAEGPEDLKGLREIE
jgi:hypothetical protein